MQLGKICLIYISSSQIAKQFLNNLNRAFNRAFLWTRKHSRKEYCHGTHVKLVYKEKQLTYTTRKYILIRIHSSEISVSSSLLCFFPFFNLVKPSLTFYTEKMRGNGLWWSYCGWCIWV
jgi:hypothetical protein